MLIFVLSVTIMHPFIWVQSDHSAIMLTWAHLPPTFICSGNYTECPETTLLHCCVLFKLYCNFKFMSVLTFLATWPFSGTWQSSFSHTAGGGAENHLSLGLHGILGQHWLPPTQHRNTQDGIFCLFLQLFLFPNDMYFLSSSKGDQDDRSFKQYRTSSPSSAGSLGYGRYTPTSHSPQHYSRPGNWKAALLIL